MVEAAEEDAGHLAHAVRHDRALGQLQIDRFRDEGLRHLQQLFRERYQLRRRQAAVPLAHGLGEGK
jgi:hypothetical protein